MQGARVILLRSANWAKHSFGAVANGRGKTGCITTNKLARIAWNVLVQARDCEARI